MQYSGPGLEGPAREGAEAENLPHFIAADVYLFMAGEYEQARAILTL